MKNKIRIALYIFTILSIGCSQSLDKKHPLHVDSETVLTQKHKRIRGTKIFAIIPDSFSYNNNFRSALATKTQSINFTKLPGQSWSEYEKVSGIYQRETIPLYGFEGNYIEMEDTKHNKIEIVVQFGDDDFVFKISASTSKEVPDGRSQLLKILQSIYYDKRYELDELELANFTFDKTIINYDLLSGYKNTYFFSKKSNGSFPYTNTISFNSFTPTTYRNLEDVFNENLSAEKIRGIKFKNEEIRDTIIGNYFAKIIESEIKFQSKTGIHCHAILSDNDNAIEISAKGFEDINVLNSSFMKILESVKFK